MVYGFLAWIERAQIRGNISAVNDIRNTTQSSTVIKGGPSDASPSQHEAVGKDGSEGAHRDAVENATHSVPNVLTMETRAKIVKWMLEEVRDHREGKICSKTVRQLPENFRSSTSANNMREMRLWRDKSRFVNDDGEVNLRGTTAEITLVPEAGIKMSVWKLKGAEEENGLLGWMRFIKICVKSLWDYQNFVWSLTSPLWSILHLTYCGQVPHLSTVPTWWILEMFGHYIQESHFLGFNGSRIDTVL